MLQRFLKPQNAEAAVAGSDEAVVNQFSEDQFIPYACHYDAATLLTKNGELLQVLRITANAEDADYEPQRGPGIRDALRDAISAHAAHKGLAFWIHTLRRRQKIPESPAFDSPFATALHNAWRQVHPWEYSYTNEIYLSVLTEGDAVDLFDKKKLYDNMFSARNRRRREMHLKDSHTALEAAVNGVLSFLSTRCNARRLQVVGRAQAGTEEPAYYSEPLEFLHFLINLEHGEMPVADADAARHLAQHELSFGFDAVESRKGKSLRRFGSILTLKGSPPLPPEAIDRCLQIPESLVVTQTFNFLARRQALSKASAAQDLLRASPDREILRRCGLEALLKSDRGQSTDFGEQQTSIMLIVDQFRHLDEAVSLVQDAFAQQGLVTVREDIRLEDVFWAQLPGNFPFLCRRSPLPASRLGTLARLNQFPVGRVQGNAWGDAVAMLPTLRGTPYFFNFHVGDTGHTALLDFNSFLDERGAVLLNFLLAGARQYHGRIFILDRGQAARPLVTSLGGRYHALDGTDAGMRLNPLQMEDSPRNRAFLAAWLLHSVRHTEEQSEGLREGLRGVLDELFALPPQARTLKAVRARMQAQGMAVDMSAGLYALFSGATDPLNMLAPVVGINMDSAVRTKGLAVPAFSYLLHRMIQTLDGTPTLIVLTEAWDLLDNAFFIPRIASLLEMLRQHNAAMVVTTRHLEDYADHHLTSELMRLTPTKLILPDDLAVDYLPSVIGLKPDALRQLTQLERGKGEFLVAHGHEAVACNFTLDGLEDYRNILAGDTGGLRLMRLQQR